MLFTVFIAAACTGTTTPSETTPPKTETTSSLLTPAIRAALDAHLELVQLRDLCGAMKSSDEQVRPLRDLLDAKQMEVWEDNAAYQDFSDQLTALAADTPGLEIEIGSEGVRVYPVYAQLGEATGKNNNSLAPIDAMVNHPFAGWMTQTWDLGGCTTLEGGATTLEPIVQGWEDLPACAREHVSPKLQQSLSNMAQWGCYCDDQPTVTAHLEKLEPLLNALAEMGGPQALETIRAGLGDAETRFDDACSG